MGASSYPGMTQPFSMSHTAANMSAVAGMRQDAMGELICNTNRHFIIYFTITNLILKIFVWIIYQMINQISSNRNFHNEITNQVNNRFI